MRGPPSGLVPRLAGLVHGSAVGLRGRAHEQWVYHMREELQSAGLSQNQWRRSQDKAAWRDALYHCCEGPDLWTGQHVVNEWLMYGSGSRLEED